MSDRFDLGDPRITRGLGWLQDGIYSRAQLLELGAAPHDIKRMLRRRELAAARPGVYADHTGPLTRKQTEWVAVLSAAPAALTHESALAACRTPVIHSRETHLDRGERQLVSTATGRRTVKDVRYPEHRLIVELDGRATRRAGSACC